MIKKELRKLISVITLAGVIFTSLPATSLYAEEVEQVQSLGNIEQIQSLEDAEQIQAHEITEQMRSLEDAEQSADLLGTKGAQAAEEAILKATRTYDGDIVDKYEIEVNQGFSYHILSEADEIKDATGANSEDVLMNDFVAKKSTAVMVKVPGTFTTEEAAKAAVANCSLVITYNSSTNIYKKVDCDSDDFSFNAYYDHDSNMVGYMPTLRLDEGLEANSYNMYIYDNVNNKVLAGRVNINFYNVKKMRLLLVPCTAYYGTSTPWKGNACPESEQKKPVPCKAEDLQNLDKKIYDYLMDVYPLAEIEIKMAATGDFSDPKYDLSTSAGRYELWNALCEYQPKGGSGVEKYDKILGFVQYRQGEESTLQGYTYDPPANVITLGDSDMLPTVAHEMAHNYQIGDEYKGGSHNNNLNPTPDGYSGTDIISRTPCASNADIFISTSPEQLNKGEGVNDSEKFKGHTNAEGTGSVVFPNLHPYKYGSNEFVKFVENIDDDDNTALITPVITFMGSDYDDVENYWSSSFIWDHLLLESLEKTTDSNASKAETKTETGAEAAVENITVYQNADNTIVDQDDFVDPLYREGAARLVDVVGKINYTSASSNAIPLAGNSLELNPLYSYNGDLSEIVQDDPEYFDDKNSDYDMYVFAALDKAGNIIKSEVDGKEAKVTFYAGNFNMASCSYGGNKDGFNDFGSFSFEAEYPEGTAKFVIYPATKPGEILKEISVPETYPVGSLVYSDISASKAKVDWIVDECKNEADGSLTTDAAKSANLHIEVYYAPEGIEGEIYKITEGKNSDFPGKDSTGIVKGANWNSYEFDTTPYGFTSDAYVLVAATDDVNSDYMYSDENNITLGNVNTSITINKGKLLEDGLKHITYTGEEITPGVTIKVFDAEGGKNITLKEDTDYKLQYRNNTDAGNATVTAVGIGNYTGKITGTFVIDPAAINTAKLSYMADLIYDGTVDKSIYGNDKCNTLREVEENMVVRLKDKELLPGSDFTVTYVNATETSNTESKTLPVPGADPVVVSLKIKGNGNYSGEVIFKKAFKLYSSANVMGIISANAIVDWDANKAYNYTGKQLKPKVKSITVDGIKLSTKYYKVTYSNNIKTGIGNINIVGKNGYVGSKKLQFNIGRLKASSLTVKGISNITYTEGIVGSDVKLPIRVYAGRIRLKEGADYTVSYNGVLDKPTVGEKPYVTITLNDDSKTVEWKNPQWKNGVKVVKKKFRINKASFSSRSLVTLNMDYVSNNGIKYFFSKNQDSKTLRKYFYYLKSSDNNNDGQPDGISESFSGEDLAMKLYVKGKEVDRNRYSVNIKMPNLLGIGRVTIRPIDTFYFSGTRTVYFLVD